MKNPFNPSPGALTKGFVGRDKEVSEINVLIKALSPDNLKPKALICFGPRGNGKTALLRHIAKNSERFSTELGLDTPVKTVITTPDDCDIPVLYSVITGKSLFVEERKQGKAGVDVNVALMKAGTEGAYTRVYESPIQTYVQLFTNVSKKSPILLCIDEAHTMPSRQMRSLLQDIQKCSEHNVAVSVVLAGTPGLETLISTCGAMFAERYPKIRVGPLKEHEAKAVLTNPFREYGMELPKERIKETMDACHNYPYFLQAYGDAIWEHCVENGMLVERDSMWERAAEDFDLSKKDMHQTRYKEIRREGMLQSAYLIAEAFKDKEFLPHEYLVRVLKEQGVTDPVMSIEKLNDFGYIWEPRGDLKYAHGTPSLMDFVVNELDMGKA
ncbi:MAG: ATP-binding protein [Gammaproteobacteria bacterium]|nr:ATP-binding protein [Gammaproteobacteria bacterium]